ncbi:MAG: DUF2892 domain-containing protein [Alphaproteobacteria bacterium]
MLYIPARRDLPADLQLHLIEGHPYAAEGVAETALEAEMVPGRLPREGLGRRRLPAIVFAAVARRHGADFERLVEDVALTGLEARLALALLRLASADGALTTRPMTPSPPGSARPRAVISRQLAAFARRGLIARTRGGLSRILAAPALKALAGEAAAAWSPTRPRMRGGRPDDPRPRRRRSPPCNEGVLDRGLRVVAGLAILSLAFVRAADPTGLVRL